MLFGLLELFVLLWLLVLFGLFGLLRLLELDNNVKKMLEGRKLDMGHARALLPLTLAQQSEVASKIVKQGLSVRATENLVKQYLTGYKKNNSKNSPKDPNISRLENDLSQRLAAKVSIAHQSTGRGKLQINYNSEFAIMI